MSSHSQTEHVRDYLAERALAGSPQWQTPLHPMSRNTAGCLLIGHQIGKLPLEDARALVRALIAEQNPDGSWSCLPGQAGDLSLTLEVVDALASSSDPSSREALHRAVKYLEQQRAETPLDEETLILLGALNDVQRAWLPRIASPVLQRLRGKVHRRLSIAHRHSARALSLKMLQRERSTVGDRAQDLLALQLADGSWGGSVRTTILAMAALRHAGVRNEDPAFERGFAFLRSLQVWDGEGLIQNPCDISNLLHATAVRTLVTAGVAPEFIGGSVFTLLHQARPNSGWSLGGLLPVDLFSTSLVLDALSFAGDTLVDTGWVRRRGTILLLRSQRPDGGWPLDLGGESSLLSTLTHRGGVGTRRSRVDVTALAVQALCYSGTEERRQDLAIANGVRFLLQRQEAHGFWRSDVVGSDLFTTARALEALMAAAPGRASAAIMKATRAVLSVQRRCGGWGDVSASAPRLSTRATAHHTAWILRALGEVPGVPREAVAGGRSYLEATLDRTELMWTAHTPVLPLPFGEDRAAVSDLTTLWVLEVLAPAASITAGSITGNFRKRTIFKRSP